nr:RagB/SusD family nutrient uptake outer membrane protein [uncultured Prevotella sp.]
MKFQYIARPFLLGMMAMSLTACGDFLEEKSQDLYIPKTTKDYKEFLLGEGLNHGKNNQVSLSEYLDVLTDDVSEYVNVRRKNATDSRERMWGYYIWNDDPEVDYNNTVRADNSWDVYYHRILVSNVILNNLAEATGTEQERKDLEGEARFLRAWSYFMLVNTYTAPYENDAQANATQAVPINNAISVENKKLAKATLGDIYRLIEHDLEASIKAFEAAATEKTIYRPNLSTAWLLRSRVALFKKQYDKAAEYATQTIKTSNKKLYDLTNGVEENKDRFLNEKNTEVLFTYGPDAADAFKLQNYITANNSEKGCFIVNPELISMYTKKDVRLEACYYTKMRRAKPYKYYALRSHGMYPYAFHLAEAYLNRAEAYVEGGKVAEALKDLDAIRDNRIYNNKALVATSAEEALQLVKDERRRELSFEGIRWFDLRRWGCPELKHTYSSSDVGGEKTEYVLKQGDKRYTLPIPRAERLINTNLQ